VRLLREVFYYSTHEKGPRGCAEAWWSEHLLVPTLACQRPVPGLCRGIIRSVEQGWEWLRVGPAHHRPVDQRRDEHARRRNCTECTGWATGSHRAHSCPAASVIRPTCARDSPARTPSTTSVGPPGPSRRSTARTPGTCDSAARTCSASCSS